MLESSLGITGHYPKQLLKDAFGRLDTLHFVFIHSVSTVVLLLLSLFLSLSLKHTYTHFISLSVSVSCSVSLSLRLSHWPLGRAPADRPKDGELRRLLKISAQFVVLSGDPQFALNHTGLQWRLVWRSVWGLWVGRNSWSLCRRCCCLCTGYMPPRAPILIKAKRQW